METPLAAGGPLLATAGGILPFTAGEAEGRAFCAEAPTGMWGGLAAMTGVDKGFFEAAVAYDSGCRWAGALACTAAEDDV